MAAHTGRTRERSAHLPGAAAAIAAAIAVLVAAHARGRPGRKPQPRHAAPHACALRLGAEAAAHTGRLALSPRGRHWSRGHRTHGPGLDAR